jgi:hypothetical protein
MRLNVKTAPTDDAIARRCEAARALALARAVDVVEAIRDTDPSLGEALQNGLAACVLQLGRAADAGGARAACARHGG